MFLENIRFQIAAIAFFIIMLVAYLTNRRIKIRSTRVFSLLLIFTGVNLTFDILTVYMICSPSLINTTANRLCHQIFIGSLDALLFFLFAYVVILGRYNRKTSPKLWLISAIPFIASIIFVIFGDLYYYNDGKSIYSYGPIANTIFVNVCVYMLGANIVVFVWKKAFDKKMRRSIIAGTIIWIVAAVVQMINPGMLTSGLAVVLMMVYIFISFENPKEYYEQDLKCFNRRAFNTVLNEKLSRGKTFYLINVSLDGFQDICYRMGTKTAREVLSSFMAYCAESFHTEVYHNRNNTVVLLLEEHEETVYSFAKAICERLKRSFPSSGGSAYLKGRVHVMDCLKYTTSSDEIYEILDYLLINPLGDTKDDVPNYIGDAILARKTRCNAIEDILEDAITNDGFYMVYQPIYSIADEAFTSAEALIRLKDTETLGFISPDEFIYIAERRGLIEKIDEIAFKKVCRFFSEEDLFEKGISYVEVNLSGMQVCNADLSEKISNEIKQHGLKPKNFNFEITETAIVESGEALHENMQKLRGMGCSFSMDDFGTGYSNLAQVAETKYDLLKIDKSLIWPCFESGKENAKIVLESVVKMALRIQVGIVAEGVETKEQRDYLKLLGVQHIQGYYYSKPLPEQEFLRFIEM